MPFRETSYESRRDSLFKMMMRTVFFGENKAMRNVRLGWITSTIAFTVAVTVFAQTEPAKPAPTKHAAPATTIGGGKDSAKHAAPAAAPAGTPTAAAIGKPAPAFKLQDVDGKEHSLSEYFGKVVVLEWANSGCPVCQRHAKGGTASKVMSNFKDKPVVWINIDSTGTATAENCKKFAADNKLGTYLMDPTGATGKAYGAKTTPHCFVIDNKGNLAYMGAIDDDKDGSKGDKAMNYVKEAIDAVLKGSTVATTTTDPYGCSVKYKG